MCLEAGEFISKVVPKGTYDALKHRGKITTHGTGGNGRTVLIEFETMPEEYRVKVREKYGDPYEYAANQPIIDGVKPDLKAREFYSNYLLPNGSYLPATDRDAQGKEQINYVARYTQNAEWLNMLGGFVADKANLKRELNISIGTFWEKATWLIKKKQIALPSTAKRLKEKLKQYNSEGYECLIDLHKFGNTNTAKVSDQLAEAFLKELLSQRNKHDDTVIATVYNKWATDNNRKTICSATVGNKRKEWRNELMLHRDGAAKVTTRLSKRIKRKRTSAPLLFVGSDDNHLDLFFRVSNKDYFRPKLYVVMDTFNDYILGYAWGKEITIELIKDAYRNAQRHVYELTGNWYSWQQLQTDRWALPVKGDNELSSFYKSMGAFTPASYKNAPAKYIERAFGQDWHRILKVMFPDNYSGHNITAKEKLNTDKLDHRNFPEVEHADMMIHAFVEQMRLQKRNGCQVSRQEEWLNAFKQSEKSQRKIYSNADRLLIFGKKHTHLNQITAEGITPTIEGSYREYELTQHEIFEYAGSRVQVYYDPEDLSQVLLTDGKGLKLIAHEYGYVPAAIADYEEGDAAEIRRRQNEKKTLMPLLNKLEETKKRVLEDSKIDAISLIQAGVLSKKESHQAQELLQGRPAELPQKSAKNNAEEAGVCAENSPENEGVQHVESDKKQPRRAKIEQNNYFDEW